MSTAGPSRRTGDKTRGLSGDAGGSDRLLRLAGEWGRARARRPACIVWVGPTEGLRGWGDADWRSAPDGLSGDSRVILPRLQLRAEVVGSQVRKEAH